MNDELLQGIIALQETQTATIKELMDVCTLLKGRVLVLEGYFNCKPLTAAPFEDK
jgi:hypothetical protein